MFQEYCGDNGIKLENYDGKSKMDIYNKFLANKRNNEHSDKSQNLRYFEKKGFGQNFLNMISMANYLIEKGHNTELFNPFKYPLQKLIKTYKIVRINDLDSKNEMLYSQIAAITSAFGDSEAVLYFDNHKNKIGEKL